MKRRVAFRSFVILLAAVMLLSSTSAYNILVYANQDSVADSLSAIESSSEAAATEPNIAVQGGSLELNSDETETQTETTVSWVGNGSQENPYQISSLAHLMQVNKMVNATEVNTETGISNAYDKHFVLTADIDVTSIFADGASPYILPATSAYLVSADSSATSSDMVYINLDGSYTDENDKTQKHKIYTDGSVEVTVKNYENFALFGYLGTNSVISNVTFENINVSVTANKPQCVSIISYRNDGQIIDCEVVNSSISLPKTSAVDGEGSSSAYYGIAGAVADNRATVSGVKVENFTLSLSSSIYNDYIGGVVAQNRGTVQGSCVSGISMTVSGINHYVGALVGYNGATVKDSTVDMSGDSNMSGNIRGGGYVGGLVGYNDTNATIGNSSVTGSITSAQSATASSYNIYCVAESSNSSVAYFGGIVGLNKGTVQKTTVSDLGVYMGFSSVSYNGCFGGIAGVTSGGVVNTSVASGSFVAQNNTSCYAGGIIGYAASDDSEVVKDCYAFYKLYVPAVDLVGAIVGFGGNSATAVNSYWSDAISGCVTSYVIENTSENGADLPYAIEPTLGKLASSNRAVTVAKSNKVTVAAAELAHTFEMIDGAAYSVAGITAQDDISLTGSGVNNTISTHEYKATLTLPADASGAPYIGSDDKQGMSISFNLDVFVTSATGDPDSKSNPLVISSYAMAKFLVQAPYGHYKLSTDIAVLSSAWSSKYFVGTLDGNGHIISTDTKIFKGVIGSRKTIRLSDKVSNPDDDDESNTDFGVIKNLNVELSADITTAVFGTAYNSSFINIDLTDSDPTPDDGVESSFEGYVANISDDYTAAFINYALGHTYIYGCSTDVSVKLGDVSYSSAFIAYIGSTVVVDNCLVNSVCAYVGTDSKVKAVFIGHGSDNKTGYVVNSVVTAQVVGTGTCYIVFGEHCGENSTSYYNITWSKTQYDSDSIDSTMNSAAVQLWGSDDKKYSSVTISKPAGEKPVHTIAIPANVSAFEDATISDFSVSLISIDEENDYAESAYTGTAITLENVSVVNGEIVLNLSFASDAEDGSTAWVKVYHYDTGLLTYARFTVIKEEFARGDDGYYHISSPADLIKFSELTNSNTSTDYLGYAYILDNNINMSGYEYSTAAASNVFKGHFDGNGKTISNLTITGSTDNVAFIGCAVSGDAVKVTDGTVDSGIFNLTIEWATVTATSESANAAVLLASSVASSTTAYSKINIKNVSIKNSNVISAGKCTAAVLAYSLNTHVDISTVSLENVTVRTGYTTELYINNNSTTVAGGIAGVLATAHDSIYYPTESITVDVKDVTVNGLELTGAMVNGESGYAAVNAGAIVATYQKWYPANIKAAPTDETVPLLSIGNSASTNEYDVVASNLLIKSTGIAGGIIGSTNARTTVSKVKVSAADGSNSQILSTTDYYIGGIAGHIGSYSSDSSMSGFADTAVVMIYGTVNDCLVENTQIRATNEAITSESNTLTRNVTVGGIVGAINGPADTETVKNCTVSSSLVEGVVVGGIVGSNINREVTTGNRISVDSCNIVNSQITTPENCYAVEVTYDTNYLTACFGVGGIIGTNRYSLNSYAPDISVTKCSVDSDTEISNYTVFENTHVYAATGGIMGFAMSLYADYLNNDSVMLEMNNVSADIISTADMDISSSYSFWDADLTAIRIGTGGFLGMFGSVTDSGKTTKDVAYFRNLQIYDSYFDGSVTSSDCIGGAIGSVINTVSYFGKSAETDKLPERAILDNLVISGKLSSTASSDLIRGGVTIGHIITITDYDLYFNDPPYYGAIEFLSGDAIDHIFSNLYYSSLEIDNTVFPFWGYCGLSWDEMNSGDTLYPIDDGVTEALIACYTDVNKLEDNSTYQIASDTENTIYDATDEFAIPTDYSAPASTRGTLFSFDGTTYWETSNSSVVAVSENAPYNKVTVTPKSTSNNPVTVSIDYTGTLTSDSDSSWSVPVKLPVGFRIYSKAEKALDYVLDETTGVKYYLISEPIDFNYIVSGNNYWLKNDIVFDAELFETNGTFDGGYDNSNVFNGVFTSAPEGTHEINGNSENTFISDGKAKTITGLKLKPVEGEKYTAAALFAFADGATLSNFNMVDVSSTSAADYAAAVAAVVTGSLTAENITVTDVNISGATYSGGLFGGMFSATEVDVPWNVKSCKVNGTRSGDESGYTYSSNISALKGAAGIAVHTDQNAAAFVDVEINGCAVNQTAATMDSDCFDNGAAGISLAFSGTISAGSNEWNLVKESSIQGEVASGAVVRTYSSTVSASFASGNMASSTTKAEALSISDVYVTDTAIKGTHSKAASSYINMLVSSAGILARVACSGVEHTISNCQLDEATSVEAPVGAGGIVGCYEEMTNITDADANPMLLSIDGCRVSAAINITDAVSITNTNVYANMGAGGIIGSLSRNVGFTGTTITDCIVDGTISGASAVGGIIGAVWSQISSSSTTVNTMKFEEMSSHFIENCVVSADFQNTSGEEAFASSNPTTGVVVGYVFDAACNNYIFGSTASSSKLTAANYPFYNIYFSGYKYPEKATYLFGVINPGTNSSQKSVNYSSSYAYSCYTDYVYDMDYVYAEEVDGNDVPVAAQINSTYHNVVVSDTYRVTQTKSEEEGIWVIDSRNLGTGMSILLSEFTFNTAPVAGATSDVTYRFNTDASLSDFTLSDANGTKTSVATLEKVTATSSSVAVEKGTAEGEYILSPVGTLTKTLVFDLVFVYSNGLELVAPFRIEVSSYDYYFASNSNGGTDYFVFNASNLSSTLELTIGENDNIIQCFDVFWTLDNADIKNTVSTYTAKTTLAEAYSGVSFGGKDIVTLLESAYHPNPEYDVALNNAENLTIRAYLGLGDDADLGSVTLSHLVKDINEIPFATYGDEDASSVYEKEFTGNYTVLQSVTDSSTGLTEKGEYYSIYGLEIHAVNTDAQENDYTNTGMFYSLGSGATVTGISFVNPRVETVGSKAEENFTGVLAGTATGANITDVSASRYADGDKAYVSSIRWMTDASTNVGGIVGKADSATTITNAHIDGIDVVGASLAGNSSKQLRTVMAGGIVGSSDATITDSTVENSRILVERNDRYRNYYLTYAGGIAARATGTISGATVSNTVMRDCTCEVVVPEDEGERSYSTYSVEDTALVADRIGGVAAFTDGSLVVSDTNVTGITIRAFDVAGGILAEVSDNADAVVSVKDCSVIEDSDIRVYSSANVASASALRSYSNAAGGAIGKIDNLSSLSIDTFDFDGYVGTYSYDNLHKDCIAGGIIGFITDKLTTLDALKIYNSTVSGEVSGYRTSKTGSMVPYLGAAGGIIGKINTTKTRSTGETAVDTMVSDCVMSAEVNLYSNVSGAAVNATLADPANSASTNVGKLLGSLVSKVTDDDGKVISSNFALNATDFTLYFKNIYVSSYPQDIVAYGSQDFYTLQISPYVTYTDLNKVVDTSTGESTGALAVGDQDLSGNSSPDYSNDEYSEIAVIPIDTDTGVAGAATRGFRVPNSSTITFGTDNTISFLGAASIVAETDIKGATIEITTETELVQIDSYYYGTLYINNVTTDIIGDIVMDYSHGLQINVQFIGMDIEGDGSEDTPFEISAPKHLAVVSALRDKYYIQTADIDLASQYSYSDSVLSPLWATTEGFKPIGTKDAPFVGSYDGQGKLITNLYINRPDTDYVGLFGYVSENATLSNIHIELAGELELSLNGDDLSEVTTVLGNVTGGDNVGGLAGYSANATVTNCSVVRGNVIGSTAVGGLVGNAAASTLTSCFTSTTVLAYYDLTSDSPSAKTAGGLVGTATGKLVLNECFTLGYTALDWYKSGSSYNIYGAVGSFIGYATSNVSVTINEAFAGAGVSASGRDTGKYRGIVIGSADSSATVSASNMFISATCAEGEYIGSVLNPILGTNDGAMTIENVSFDKGINGDLAKRAETGAVSAEFSLDGIDIGATAQESDTYTAAYVDFASVAVKASDSEASDADRYYDGEQLGGLFYPVTIADTDVTVTSSTIDISDTRGYYSGIQAMDAELYGNGSYYDYADKNTDLLFKNTEDGITVYSNIYTFGDKEFGQYSGTAYDNGELFYDYAAPYFTVEKSVDGYELYRKVTYPVQNRTDCYPISTERQLNALAGYEQAKDESVSNTFTSFPKNKKYVLVENITLGMYDVYSGTNVMPISDFTGVLDGKGYTVSNVNISGTDKVGFFSELTTGCVKNLNLEVTSVTGNDYVGGLVGYIGANGTEPSSTTITNCSVSSYGDSGRITGNEYVGGLVGYAVAGTADTAKNPVAGIYGSHTEITVNGTNVVGGLVGASEMYIINCYSTGDVKGAITGPADDSDTYLPRGIGGLVGLLKTKSVADAYPSRTDEQALLSSSFSSSAVDVSSVSGYNSAGNGVGGLIGNVNSGTLIKTVFSSGSVHFCYDDSEKTACGSVPALGIGGLIGVLNSPTTDVYSSASVAARVGELTEGSSVVGIGGVVGISNAKLQSAYSSGSTLGETVTTDETLASGTYYYGVGGVLGLVSSDGLASDNLYFDRNASVVSSEPIGKVTSGELTSNNIGSKSTKEFTNATETSFLGESFRFTTGAYPYLESFFDSTVSEVIRLNALLSIVAVQVDERDTSALNGDGVSMAMTIPTEIEHNGIKYTYGFEADNSISDSATSIVDTKSNTLTFQRTSNESEPANFIVTIATVDNSVTNSDGVYYSSIASRPFSRVTAEMLGTPAKPYLIASQEDLEHVAMKEKPTEGMYSEWNTPNEGTMVYYRLMGYFELDGEYDNSNNFGTLGGGYTLDGNGYSIRKLSTTLATTLDELGTIKNITFEDASFEDGESLIGTLNGSAIGVNVYGKASGSKVAGLAQTVGESGVVQGCISGLDYSGSSATDVAGLVLTNEGTVEMSASVGNISGTSLGNVSAFVGTNKGTIKNSFTMGDIVLSAPVGIVAGFVGTNSGTVESCYTRCNFKVTNASATLTIGSFAGINSTDCVINDAFAAGLFDVRLTADTDGNENPADLSGVFIGSNSGTLTDVMFDKQLSGTCFKDIFTYAESTSDIATLANHSLSAYTVAAKTENGETVAKGDEYPQLKVILATANSEDEVTVRMYSSLRSYSSLSAVTAVAANDNYIDNIPKGTVTPVTAKDGIDFSDISDTNVATIDKLTFVAKDVGSAYAILTTEIECFYDVNNTKAAINLYFAVDEDGANPNFAGGCGTDADPYQISTKEQVVALSYYGKNASNHFKVINDINMAQADWNVYIKIFRADLDGNGHTLSDITIPSGTNDALFGKLDGASIRNLSLANISVTTDTDGASGLLAASVLNDATVTTVTNCIVFGELNAPTGSNVGGIFGETDGQTVIDGCIVSGKIKSGATNVGGLIGLVTDGTAAISNCLSTALVIGSDSTGTATGGIIGSGAATVTNTVVAGNVKGNTVGNIAGESENVTVTNSYYDKQLSTVDGGAEAATTYFLTQGAASDAFGDNMQRISGFVGYPVPTYFASATGTTLNTVKLASAAVVFSTGIGAGTSTTFTIATPTSIDSAVLGVTGSAADNKLLKAENGVWSTDTSSMTLGQVYDGELTYALDGMTRYIDVQVGKKITTVNYTIVKTVFDDEGNSKIDSFDENEDVSIISAITGDGGAATAATAFDSEQNGVLCNDMVFTYDIVTVDGTEMAQLFRVETQLPDGYKQGTVTVVFNTTTPTTVTAQTDDNGIAYILVPTDIEVFDTIDITVTAVSTDTWGVRNLFGLFR